MKPDNTAMANKREQRIELGEAMKEARGMAMDAIKDMKDQKKYAPVIGKMMTQISEISDKYQRLDNKQIRWVQEAAIASFTTHASDTMIDAFNAEAAKSGNAVFKKFSEDRGRKLRVSSLLNAASKVNISDRLTGRKMNLMNSGKTCRIRWMLISHARWTRLTRKNSFLMLQITYSKLKKHS